MNPKQEKRFWSADQKRFVYSLDSPLQDCFEALLRMNDNDIMEAQRYKQKKLRQFNEDELAEVFVSSEKHRFRLLDESDGTLYDYDTANALNWQGGISRDDPTAP